MTQSTTNHLSESPFPSWVYDEQYGRWNPPHNHPDDEKQYRWVEETTEWVEIIFED